MAEAFERRKKVQRAFLAVWSALAALWAADTILGLPNWFWVPWLLGIFAWIGLLLALGYLSWREGRRRDRLLR